MTKIKIYRIFIKCDNYYTTLTFQAENEDEALKYARSQGEIIRILGVIEIDDISDIDYNEQMLNRYPEVIKAIREFQVLIKSQSFQVKELHNELSKVFSNAFIGSADKNRIEQWEKLLGIIPLPQGDDSEETWLADRRETILARLYHLEKLNSKSIAEVVSIFTGGTAVSYFKDSTIHVLIYPPKNNKQYKFENVEQELIKKKPAHLGFKVERGYITWLEINQKFSTWQDVKNAFNTWEDVLLTPPSNI
jgi:hypothetical protein